MIKELFNKYKTFIAYIFSAGLSFAVDLTLFTIFVYVYKLCINEGVVIIAATISARILSSCVNYLLNRNKVFKQDDGKKMDKRSLILYVSLVIIQMLVSSFTVTALYNFTHFNETIIKIPVECVLFLVNYVVQKNFIFKSKNAIIHAK